MRYFFKRLVSSLLALWMIITVTFFLMKSIPGDPFTEEKALPKEVIQSLYEYYKLNKPWYIQYGSYIKSVITWNFGLSFKYKTRTVNDIIKNAFPVSALLGLEALVLAIFCGIFLGMLAAIKHNQWQDYTAMIIAVIGISIPSFLVAALLQYLFSIKISLFPIARWGTFQHTILPALSLAALPIAFIARLIRSNMIEVLSTEYIQMARSKGIKERDILLKHVLKNALFPVVSYLGTLVTNILTGSFIVEKIFGIPGLGQWLINSIANRDYTMIMGLTVFYSILLLSAILLADLLYACLDPRVKLGEAHNNGK